VERAVSEGVHFKAGDGLCGFDVGEHVVPLQDLVQEDSVDEAAESYAKEDSPSLHEEATCPPILTCVTNTNSTHPDHLMRNGKTTQSDTTRRANAATVADAVTHVNR